MSRFYKGIKLKKHRVYTFEDLIRAFGISRNTVSNWVKAGLQPVDWTRPYLFRGETVNAFHDARRKRDKTSLRPGEFKCTGCKMAVFPAPGTLVERPSRSGAKHLQARCAECGVNVFRFVSMSAHGERAPDCDPNTTEGRAHEERTSVPSGIGISPAIDHGPNERLIYEWQKHAGRYSEKTIDRHLSAIRWLEGFLEQKPFEKLTMEDCYAVRDHLKVSLQPGATDPKSKSTVQHCLSHLKEFLKWLLKQSGYSRLPAGLPDALQLPKAAYSAGLPKERKTNPTLEEAGELLMRMPFRSPMQMRARAIFALAFLGALRADTLISLRLGDVDCDKREILQDARTARTKNGKSQIIAWFPVPEEISDAVVDWVKFMRSAGFCSEDALFPRANAFQGLRRSPALGGQPIASMTSCHAVTEAFHAACKGHHTEYTPHSAKHTIAAERDRRPLTMEQRKAWSENMGHENEQITTSHYGKLTPDRRLSLLAQLPLEHEEGAVLSLSDEEKIAFVDDFWEKIVSHRQLRS